MLFLHRHKLILILSMLCCTATILALVCNNELKKTRAQLNASINTIQNLEQQLQKISTETQAQLAPAAKDDKHINPLDSIFEPEESSASQHAASDALKRRFEALLVTHLYLRRCEQTQPYDFYIIQSALAQEMASINTPGRLQHDILTSARGSYQEMYANTPCNADNIGALLPGYRAYLDTIVNDYHVH